MTTLSDEDPFAPIYGCSLVHYAQICRGLVRGESGAHSTTEDVLRQHRLTPEQWAQIEEGWSARIRLSDAVRAAFRELYARN